MRIISLLLKLIILLLINGCGGGSVGTGTGDTRMLEGRVSTTEQKPVQGATVTLEQTGDYSLTDSEGRFSIEANIPIEARQLNLRVDFGDLSQTVTVDTGNSSVEDALSFEIEIDPRAQSISAKNLRVVVKVVGACDRYFENKRVIRQANKIANGTDCTVKAEIFGDGKPLERVPFLVERAGCVGKTWNFVSAGETGFGVDAGVGQAQFTYYDSDDFCQYRVTAPFGLVNLTSVIYKIHTFRKQRYDELR